jgi:hypothetical protein
VVVCLVCGSSPLTTDTEREILLETEPRPPDSRWRRSRKENYVGKVGASVLVLSIAVQRFLVNLLLLID